MQDKLINGFDNNVQIDNMNETQKLINKASTALSELENKIKEEQQVPEENIDITKYNLIKIPSEYIRTATFFRKEYRLNHLINNQKSIDNIAYSLQLSDLNNYFINRFNLFLSVGVVFRKQALINIVSIQEGLLKCTYLTLREYCVDHGNTCSKNSNCKYYLKSLNNIRNDGLLKRYKEVIGLNDQHIFTLLSEQKAVRDKIHIHHIDENELFNNQEYTLNKYNEAIMVLKYLKTNLCDCVSTFKQAREKGCEGFRTKS